MNKTFIIAELGINHNGDLNKVKKLIDVAKDAGCDAVKFQKRTIEKVYSKEELDRPRESPWGTTNREQKQGLELRYEDYCYINEYCDEIALPWFASAWDTESVQILDKFDLKYNKIASAMLTHRDLVKMIIDQKRYTFISTGMSTLAEILEVVDWFKSANCPFELMHCNSQYPMPDKLANLNCIKTLRDMFNCKVGYSGHEVGLITSVAAVVLGATSIERHITLDRSMYGSDQASSIEPQGLRALVQYIRTVESALGDGTKCITEAEEKCKAKLRRCEDYGCSNTS